MTKFLSRYFVFSLFLLVAFMMPFFVFRSENDLSVVFADDVNVYLGGQVTDSTAESGSQQNPASTFLDAKNILSNSAGTIWVNGSVSIAESQSWDLSSNQKVKRNAAFTGVMFTITDDAVLTLQNIVIDGNSEVQSAGSVFKLNATAVLNIGEGVEIRNNNTTVRGGAILLEASTAQVNLNGGSILDNTTTQQGGAVYISYGSSFTLNSGTISGNQAKVGGALFVETGANVSILQGTITNNSVTGSGCAAGAIYSVSDLKFGDNPQISGNYCVNQTNVPSNIYIDYGKAIYLNTALNSTSIYNVNVFASSRSIPPRAVLIGHWGALTDASAFFENFVFENDAYDYSIGANEFAGNIMVNQFVTLTFHANNGSGNAEDVVAASGSQRALSNVGFSAPQGYVLAGWSLAEGGALDFALDYEYSIWDSENFYAVYTRPVTYNANGGTGTLAGTKYYDIQYVSELGTQFSKEGFDLVGWGVSATTTESDIGFFEVGSVVSESVLSTYNFTLYAVWKEKSYTVSYDTGFGSPVDEVEVDYMANIPNAETTLLGYNFVGWFEKYMDDSISDTPFDFENEKMGNSDIMLVAKWTAVFKNSDAYTTDGYFEIENIDQLNSLSQLVNLGKSGYLNGSTLNYNVLSYKLTNDIVLSNLGQANFTPIGTLGRPFSGNFDGGLNKISNLNVGNNISYTGLFGVATNAVIKNIIIIQATVNGFSTAGGVVAQATNSQILNCAFGGSIVTTNSQGAVGGIAGNVLYDTIIEKCVVNVAIDSASLAGGIVGRISNSMVNACAVLESSIVSADKTGGIVGFVDSSATLRSSYFYGTVAQSTFYGSVVGYNLGTVEQCYYVTDTNSVGAINNTNVLDKVLGLSSTQMLSLDDNVCGFGLSDEFANTTALDSTQAFVFKAKQGEYAYLPVVSGFGEFLDEVFAVKVFVVTFELACESGNETWIQYVKQNGYAFEPFYKTLSTLTWYDGLEEWNFVTSKVVEDMTLAAVYENGVAYFAGGTGAENDPFKIETYKNFIMFTNLLNNISTYHFFANKHFRLENDIDCADKTMIVVGDINHKFTGVFDGNNHIISNFKITRQQNYVGLFGYNSGTIMNLKLRAKQITGQDYVGAVCGYNAGTIDNITLVMAENTSVVSGNNYVGGIAGYNIGSIVDCATNVPVKAQENFAGGICGYSKGQNANIEKNIVVASTVATNYVGGIVGYAYSGNVLNCFYNGQAQGRYAGGIVGFASCASIKYVVAWGYVVGSEYAGGLVGYGGVEANLEISYSINQVVATEKFGGVAGVFLGNVSYCYYSKNEYDIGGVNGQSTQYSSVGIPENLMLTVNGTLSQYLDSEFTQATYLGADVWYAKQDENGSWFFPIQTALVGQINYTYTNCMLVTLNYTKNSTETTSQTMSLVLKNDFLTSQILPYFAEYMGITGADINALKWYSDSEKTTEVAVISDQTPQLYANWQAPFSGVGTQINPFVIRTEADLCLLSSLVNDDSTNAYYGSKYYVLAANIGITTSNFVPIGLNEELPFSGNFNGNGKTILNLYIQLPAKSNVGLFGVLNNATIHDLNLSSGQINACSTAGAVAGLCVDSTITNCKSTVTIVTSMGISGGVAGKTINSQVCYCVSFSCYVISSDIAGGIVGMAEQESVIQSCVVNNAVYAKSQVGGAVGCLNKSNICYIASLANISGEDKVGGLVGLAHNSARVFDSYFILNIEGQTDVGGIAGRAVESIFENCFFNIERCASIEPINGLYNNISNVSGESAFVLTTETFWNDNTHWTHRLPEDDKFFYPVVAGISNLSNWYDNLILLDFEVSNVLIDEQLTQYGHVLQGGQYKFKVQVNDDRSYDMSTFSIQCVINGEAYNLLDEQGVYTINVTGNAQIVVSVEPVKRTVLVVTSSGGTSDKIGTNLVNDRGMFEIGFNANKGYYVSDVKVDNASVIGWTQEGYSIAEVDSNTRVDVYYSKIYVEKSFVEQDGTVVISGSKIYHDAEINTIRLNSTDDKMQMFKKKASGDILCAYDFETVSESEQVLSGDISIKIYVGANYNNKKMELLLIDDGVVKSISTTVSSGYITLNASKLRAFAVVRQGAGYGWLWLLALIIVCVFVLIAISTINSRKGNLKANGTHSIMASSVDLNYVERRNDYCKSKPVKLKDLPAESFKRKGTKKNEAKIDSIEAKISREEKKQEVKNKLGVIRRNED